MARRATTVFVALAAADTVLAGMGLRRLRWLTKPLLMPVLMAGSDRSSRRALAFGAAGDVALLGSGDAAFTAGLVSFLAGHVAWITALRQRPGAGRLRSCPALALPYLAAFGSPFDVGQRHRQADHSQRYAHRLPHVAQRAAVADEPCQHEHADSGVAVVRRHRGQIAEHQLVPGHLLVEADPPSPESRDPAGRRADGAARAGRRSPPQPSFSPSRRPR